MSTPETLTFTRVPSDACGNPRYAVRFLNLNTREELDRDPWIPVSEKYSLATKRAFSGRLTITEPTPGQFVLDYCTGQYCPTEYRRAVCAVLSSALWDYWRECDGPASTGDTIRKTARAELSRSIAQRWFN